MAHVLGFGPVPPKSLSIFKERLKTEIKGICLSPIKGVGGGPRTSFHLLTGTNVLLS